MSEKSAQDHGHIRALDGVRGWALLAVFFYHAVRMELPPISRPARFVLHVTSMGWAGVDLFFVLSGFLITTILLNAQRAQNYYKVFYMGRVLRIFPLYYLVLAASLVFEPGHVSFKHQIFYWLNLSNLPTAFVPYLVPYLAHFWSLGIEEQFYLIWSTVVRKFRPQTIGWICAATVLGDLVLRNLPVVIALDNRWSEFVYRLTIFRVDTLCAGALLAVLLHQRVGLPSHRVPLRTAFVVSGCLFCSLAFWKPYDAASIVRVGYTALIVCCFSLIALSMSPGSTTARFFSNSFLRRTGKYSYCFYLVHPFVISYFVIHFDPAIRALLRRWMSFTLSSFALVALEFAVSFAISALSWRFLEGPILRFKRHFRYTPAPKHHLA